MASTWETLVYTNETFLVKARSDYCVADTGIGARTFYYDKVRTGLSYRFTGTLRLRLNNKPPALASSNTKNGSPGPR